MKGNLLKCIIIFYEFNLHKAQIGGEENLSFRTAAKFTSFIITPHRPSKSIKFDIERRDAAVVNREENATENGIRSAIIKCANLESMNDRATSITDWKGSTMAAFPVPERIKLVIALSQARFAWIYPSLCIDEKLRHASFTRVDVNYFQKR